MPAISSDECVIPSRRTQLGMIGYARMLAGVSGIDPGPAFSSRTPSPPRFVGRSCPPTPVRRLGIGGRRCAHDSSSEDAGPPASQCVHQQTLHGGPGNEGLHDHGANPGALSSGADGDNEGGGIDDSGGGQHVGQDQSPRRRARSALKSAVPARKRYRKGAARPARVAPIPLGMRKAAAEIERSEAACLVMETCLRAAAGLVTGSANFSRGGVLWADRGSILFSFSRFVLPLATSACRCGGTVAIAPCQGVVLVPRAQPERRNSVHHGPVQHLLAHRLV